LILIKIEKCGHCFYCDIIEYRDNFLDNNREMIFLISPNPSEDLDLLCFANFTQSYICTNTNTIKFTNYQSINGRVYATALRQLQQNEHDTFYIRSLVI
jgi:hypothetical protein